MSAIHGASKTIQTYIWVIRDQKCWETRGLSEHYEASQQPKRILDAASGDSGAKDVN